ncbi:MAG: ABC transporter ATP-binding protein [Actinomycetaceae bacterium]
MSAGMNGDGAETRSDAEAAAGAASTGASTSAGAALEVRGISAGYGRTRVLHDVSLDLPAGGSLGIVGESGSGKTTLARVIAGEHAPESGEILLDGEALTRRRTSAQRRAIQVVHQDPYSSLNPRLRIGSVLTELLAVHRLRPRAERRARAEELMRLVSLPVEALDAFPGQLSGGQRQRAAIARALAVEPRLLVADEPTSALDVTVQATVLALLDDLRERLGLTILLISHDLAVVHHLTERVGVMRDGRLVELAGTDEVFRRPTDPYTRRLLASAPRLAPAAGRVPPPDDDAPSRSDDRPAPDDRPPT